MHVMHRVVVFVTKISVMMTQIQKLVTKLATGDRYSLDFLYHILMYFATKINNVLREMKQCK